MKKMTLFLLLAGMMLLVFPRGSVQSAAPSPYDLIAAVNELRASLDLKPLEVNSALMAAAQGQSDYLASISPNVGDGHAGPDGSRAIDRAAAAGYPLGPGWNVVECWAGPPTDTSLSTVIYDYWGDESHWNVMTTVDGVHVGAGVSEADGRVYYILDVGVNYGSGGNAESPSGAASTIPTTAATAAAAPVKVASPQPDGSIIHTVETGQAPWSIAAAYDITIDQLYGLNNLTENDFIYVGQELLVQVAYTPTPSPTTTQTPRPPTRTPIPPQTAEAVPTQEPRTDNGGFLGMNRSTTGLVLILVSGVGLALMLVSVLGRDKNPEKKQKDSNAD